MKKHIGMIPFTISGSSLELLIMDGRPRPYPVIEIFFEGPFETKGIVPTIAVTHTGPGQYSVRGGCFNFTNASEVYRTDDSAGFVPEGSYPATNPHWSLVAMVHLAQDWLKKIQSSSDPQAIAYLSATSAAGFREFDGRNADWVRDLQILSLCKSWEENTASQSEMLSHAESQNILPVSRDAAIASKWLSTRIRRLKRKYG